MVLHSIVCYILVTLHLGNVFFNYKNTRFNPDSMSVLKCPRQSSSGLGIPEISRVPRSALYMFDNFSCEDVTVIKEQWLHVKHLV